MRWPHRRRVSFRPVLVVLLCVGATAVSSSFGSFQRSATSSSQGESFARAARRAVAYGGVAEAEALAKGRPAGDSEAAAVLARLAIRRGDYEGARTLLEPAAVSDPSGEAALELGLLLQWWGKRDDGSQLLEGVFRNGSDSEDPEVLFRAARAAQGLNQPFEANPLFRAAAAAGRASRPRGGPGSD